MRHYTSAILSAGFLTLLTGLIPALQRTADAQAEDIAVLIVTAHPDDEALFAGSVYRLTKQLGGAVDLALLTDGAGGYRFSTLAEDIYGLDLTDPQVAKQYLPAIRKQELMAGGRIIGLRNYYFIDQPDTGYGTDPDSIIERVWDSDTVVRRLRRIVDENDYDFIFTSLPRPDTHAHHKAAAILSIKAVSNLPVSERPAVLGGWIRTLDDTTAVRAYHTLDGYPETAATSSEPLFSFDRTMPFGRDDRLNYKIPASWLIAEHKTQGTMQHFINRGDIEIYWLFDVSPEGSLREAQRLFDLLNTPPEEDL